jgi:hypothetical protein
MMAEQGKEQEVELEGFGVKGKLKNMHLGNILQMAIVGVGVWAAITFAQVQKEMKDEHAALARVLEGQSLVLQKQLEAQVEFNYIITLKADAREALNLQMPASLRSKIREFR